MPEGLENVRTLRKYDNRKKLIEATISLIAEEGIASVTVSRVVARAGVSRGLINLHFDTKEAMMIEVIDSLNLEWQEAARGVYAAENMTAADRLLAVLMISLNPPILDSRKMAVWYCFYADPWYRKIYQERYSESDQQSLEAMAGLLAELDREGGYGYGDPMIMARSLRSLIGGLWLEVLTEPDRTNMEEARACCLVVLRGLYHKHFPSPESSPEPGASP